MGAYEEHKSRQQAMIERYGKPEPIAASDALALAKASLVPLKGPNPVVTADQVYASIYRDDEAAGAWLASNLEHHGHPALAKVPLSDGRVIGILDLRPALAKAAEIAGG